METFDDIRVLDLHGNKEIREAVPDGISDQNIFDIKQGVCIIIALRKKPVAHNKNGRVMYSEIWGLGPENEQLNTKSIKSIKWSDCNPSSPNYTFHPSGAQA